MEQDIRCNNHPHKNATGLCNGCGVPFCAECLRKNLLGFYYCRRCYPALFENTTAPEYEISRDEKGLRRIQKQIGSNINDESTYESISFIKGIGIGLGVFLFNFMILILFLPGKEISYLGWIILVAIITYFLAGLYCGKFWPEHLRRWGFWLTIPYGFAVILLMMSLGDVRDRALAGSFLMIFIFLYFVLVLISSIGAYVGAHIDARLRPHPLDKSQDNE